MSPDDPESAAAAFPDPVYLGIMPLDDDWKLGFDGAVAAVRKLGLPEASSMRWSLNFACRHFSRNLEQNFQEPLNARAFNRPHALAGDSASAAFACLLALNWSQSPVPPIARNTVMAAVDRDGRLLPVGHINTKLDRRLWDSFLHRHVDRVIVCPGNSSVDSLKRQGFDVHEARTLHRAIELMQSPASGDTYPGDTKQSDVREDLVDSPDGPVQPESAPQLDVVPARRRRKDRSNMWLAVASCSVVLVCSVMMSVKYTGSDQSETSGGPEEHHGNDPETDIHGTEPPEPPEPAIVEVQRDIDLYGFDPTLSIQDNPAVGVFLKDLMQEPDLFGIKKQEREKLLKRFETQDLVPLARGFVAQVDARKYKSLEITVALPTPPDAEWVWYIVTEQGVHGRPPSVEMSAQAFTTPCSSTRFDIVLVLFTDSPTVPPMLSGRLKLKGVPQ